LPEPQELFLENLVSAGTTFVSPAGVYAVINERRLVEFFVPQDLLRQSVTCFEELRELTGFSAVICKSFDRQLLFTAFAQPARVSSGGLLFRKIVDPRFSHRAGIEFRVGCTQDVQTILDIDDGFFENPAEIENYIAQDGLVLLETTNRSIGEATELIGCGIAKPVISGREGVDIGMLVAPAQRRRGYGAHIICYLKERCLQRGERPICGCSVDNLGSQRALANAGFIAEHRMLVIEY